AERSCSENLSHLAPMSLRTICLVSAAVAGVTPALGATLVMSDLQNIDEISLEWSSSKRRMQYKYILHNSQSCCRNISKQSGNFVVLLQTKALFKCAQALS